jgi:hypothetical protein
MLSYYSFLGMMALPRTPIHDRNTEATDEEGIQDNDVDATTLPPG